MKSKPNAIVQSLIAQTMRELSAKPQLTQQSRVWSHPEGFQNLAVWQNAALLRLLIRQFTKTFPVWEQRLKAQMDDCARSVKRNIEEGWKRPTTAEYLQFLGYSQASLEELRGDIRDCKADGFLKSIPGTSLKSLGFDLDIFKGPVKGELRGIKGEPTDPSHPYSQPLAALKTEAITYEALIELANKTDYLLRSLVQSLESKLTHDQKTYQIQQLKIKERIKR